MERDSLIGAIVRDTTVASYPRYAVGWSGFLCLGSGDFIPYDSAFPGPEFFMVDAFEVEQ